MADPVTVKVPVAVTTRYVEMCPECKHLASGHDPETGCSVHLDPKAHHAPDRECDCTCEFSRLEVMRLVYPEPEPEPEEP